MVASAYLDQQEQVRVLALGGGTVALLDVVLCDVDTLHTEEPLDRVRACRAVYGAHHLALAGICGSGSSVAYNTGARRHAVAENYTSPSNKV